MAKLQHPNILRCYGGNLEGQAPFIVTELCECSLDKVGPLPESITQVCLQSQLLACCTACGRLGQQPLAACYQAEVYCRLLATATQCLLLDVLVLLQYSLSGTVTSPSTASVCL